MLGGPRRTNGETVVKTRPAYCRAPIVLRGVNFTLCTPQWFALAFHTAIPFPLRVTPFSHTFKAVYTRIFSAGRLIRPLQPVRCLLHFSLCGAGLQGKTRIMPI